MIAIILLFGCHDAGSSAQLKPVIQSENSDADEPSLRADPVWSDENSLKAMVLSDLHYTEDKEVDASLVPGIAVAEEITDAIVAEADRQVPGLFGGGNAGRARAGDQE